MMPLLYTFKYREMEVTGVCVSNENVIKSTSRVRRPLEVWICI